MELGLSIWERTRQYHYQDPPRPFQACADDTTCVSRDGGLIDSEKNCVLFQ